MVKWKVQRLRKLLVALGLVTWALALQAHAAGCPDLTQLKLPDTTIQRAEWVPAGSFADADPAARSRLPAFCRVVARVRSEPGSDIAVEIWLPERWTGVFHGTGAGGYAGHLRSGYPAMVAGLQRGYASATTDMGASPALGQNGDPLIGLPRKWRDWGLLSTHVMTVTGKAIAKAYYGDDSRRAYFTGCSTGGQQGLIEALHYPEDYDGILVGAPVVNRTWGHAAFLWDYLAANRSPGHTLSEAKLSLLGRAALANCGGRGSGLPSDPFIGDPLSCRFDPGSLACGTVASDGCLTEPELQTARAFYSGPTDRSGRPTYYGWAPGSEAPVRSWMFLQSPPRGEPAYAGMFKWVFGAGWDWRAFDFERDMPKVDAMLSDALNGAARGDMTRFRDRGGRLIMYHGWSDSVVAPGQTLAFYNGLAEQFGAEKVGDFARLFMAPGVMHCGGGPGPGAFNSAYGGAPSDSPSQDLFSALVAWVERGRAPDAVVATKYVDDARKKGVAMQRPLCAFPKKAWYDGAGDPNEATAFSCRTDGPRTQRK
jgi:feruloyl esterase